MNLGEARTEMGGRGFNYLSALRLTLMLNNGKDAFEDFWSWPWLELGVSGNSPLAVNRLKTVLYVQDASRRRELIGLDVRSLAQDGDAISQPGIPIYWWLAGPYGDDETVTINTWPADPTLLESRVTVRSPVLVNQADTPLIPARYHGLWLDLSVCEAYQDSDNFSGAQALRAAVNGRLQDVVMQYETANRQHSVISAQRVYSEDD